MRRPGLRSRRNARWLKRLAAVVRHRSARSPRPMVRPTWICLRRWYHSMAVAPFMRPHEVPDPARRRLGPTWRRSSWTRGLVRSSRAFGVGDCEGFGLLALGFGLLPAFDFGLKA